MKKIAILSLVLILTACGSSISVVSDYDKTVDFNNYKTISYYGWADNSDKILNRFDKERIEKAFAEEFEKRGLKIVDGPSDLIVALHIVTERKTQVTANTVNTGGMYGYGGYYGYGPGWGYGGGMSSTTYNEYEYTNGSLSCSVYDVAKEVLVWESIGTGVVDEDPESREESIPEAVAKIMERYPVQPVAVE